MRQGGGRTASPLSLVSPRSLYTPDGTPSTEGLEWLGSIAQGPPPNQVPERQPRPPQREASPSLPAADSTVGFSLDSIAWDGAPAGKPAASAAMPSAVGSHAPVPSFSHLFRVPTVMDLVGPPPSLPTLSRDHALAPLVDELRSWVSSSMDLYEARDAHRRDVMKQCITAAHRQAVAAAKRAGQEAAAAGRAAEDARACTRRAEEEAGMWRRRCGEAEASTAAAVARAVEEREAQLNRCHREAEEVLRAQVRLFPLPSSSTLLCVCFSSVCACISVSVWPLSSLLMPVCNSPVPVVGTPLSPVWASRVSYACRV